MQPLSATSAIRVVKCNTVEQCTAEEWLQMVRQGEDSASIIKVLETQRSFLNYQAHTDGKTALILAAQNGHIEIVAALLN